jgi:hypothetical protein
MSRARYERSLKRYIFQSDNSYTFGESLGKSVNKYCRTCNHQKEKFEKERKKKEMYIGCSQLQNWVLTTFGQASTAWRVDRDLVFYSLDGQTHTAQHNQHNTKARPGKMSMIHRDVVGAFRWFNVESLTDEVIRTRDMSMSLRIEFLPKENNRYPGFGSMFIVSVPTGSRSISRGNIRWLRETQKVPLARG